MLIELVRAVDRLARWRQRHRHRRHTTDKFLQDRPDANDDDSDVESDDESMVDDNAFTDGAAAEDEGDAGVSVEKEPVFFTLESIGYSVGQRFVERYVIVSLLRTD